MRRVKFGFIALAILFGLNASAQKAFKYSAALEKISGPGFYKILLSPDVLSKTRSDLADVRIIDEKDQQVPYIFGSSLPAVNSVVLSREFETSPTADTISAYVISNQEGYSLNQLVLQLRNTEVKRTLNLSGSDDAKKWFAIKENMPLDPPASAGKNGTYEQLLNFPLSTYRFFRIEINSNRKLPVDIASVGIYKWRSVEPSYTGLPAPIITQRDSDKISYATLNFKQPYQINKLQLKLEGAKFYNRELRVFDEKHNLIHIETINSSKPADLTFSVKTDKIYVEVSNRDNPPLKIQGANASQLDQTLVTYLEEGKQYKLLFGDEQAVAPDYDLGFFTNIVTQQPVMAIKHLSVTANNNHEQGKSGLPPWIIWVAIAAVAIVLLTLTLKMTREVNKRSQA